MSDTESDTTRVAVGLDYETESPWVWTKDVDEDAADASGWFAVDIPTALVDRFKAACAEYDAAIEAIHEHAGYDQQWHRLKQRCDGYRGDKLVIGGRDFWDDCQRCGWKREDHPEAADA